jgi:hypothetical protein
VTPCMVPWYHVIMSSHLQAYALAPLLILCVHQVYLVPHLLCVQDGGSVVGMAPSEPYTLWEQRTCKHMPLPACWSCNCSRLCWVCRIVGQQSAWPYQSLS